MHRISVQSRNPSSGYVPQSRDLNRHLCANIRGVVTPNSYIV